MLKTTSISGYRQELGHSPQGLHLARKKHGCGKQQAMAFSHVENNFHIGRKTGFYFLCMCNNAVVSL